MYRKGDTTIMSNEFITIEIPKIEIERTIECLRIAILSIDSDYGNPLKHILVQLETDKE